MEWICVISIFIPTLVETILPENYWKSTDVTDKVYDYWNHGPIYIPGLQDIFTLSTKSLDIFPPWLTRTTVATTTKSTTRTTSIPTSPPTTTVVTTVSATPTTTHATTTTTPAKTTTSTTVKLTEPKNPITVKRVAKKMTATTKAFVNTTYVTATEETTHLSAEDEWPEDGFADPFSVFLRRLFRVLSGKSLPELPALAGPVSAYISKLIVERQLDWVDPDIMIYIKRLDRNLKIFLMAAPDILHTRCYEIYNKLSHRHTALDEDINGLLATLDDLFTQQEEEDMQNILFDFIEFPKINKTAEEIAHDFIEYVFIEPLKRVSGSSRGQALTIMLRDILSKRDLIGRRYLKNAGRNIRAIDHSANNDDSRTYSHKSSLKKRKFKNNRRGKKRQAIKKVTEGMYQTVRSNMRDIKYLMRNVEVSSAETNEYELSDSLDEDRLKKEILNTQKKTLTDSEEKTKSENSDYEAKKILDTKSTIKENDKYSPADLDKLKDIHDMFPRVFDEYKGRKRMKTVLVPRWPLLTKLIKDNVNEYESGKKTRSYKLFSFQNTYERKPRTKPFKKISYESEKTGKVLLEKQFVKYPYTHRTIGYSSRHHHRQINKKHKIATHMRSTQIYGGKPITQLNYPYSSENDVKLPSTIKHYIKNKTKSTTHKRFNVSTFDIFNNEFIKLFIEREKPNESEDSSSYSEYSSRDTDKHAPEDEIYATQRENRAKTHKHHKQVRNRHKKRKQKKRRHKHGHVKSHHGSKKYKNLKRKYEKLKKILAEHKIIYERNRPEENTTQIDMTIKQPDVNIKYQASTRALITNPQITVSKVSQTTPTTTTTTVTPSNRFNQINMFLDDYDGKTDFPNNNSLKENDKIITRVGPTGYTLLDYGHFRKVFPQNTTDNIETADYSDAEKELKKNIHDAFRHMDFVNYNASRRSFHNDSSLATLQDSPETDVEAVLKSNIYKAVKKLLK